MALGRQIVGDSYVFTADGANTPLQVVPWSGQRVSIAFSGTSARVALPTGAEVLELTATENCYIAFGDNTVVASSTIASDGSRLFLAGVQNVTVPIDAATDEPYTYIAAIQSTAGGILQAEAA